jgi:hypothetical protein
MIDYIKRFLQQRRMVRAFESDDMDWVRETLGDQISERAIPVAFHKARLEHPHVSLRKRMSSADWLADRGYSRTNGTPPHTALGLWR